MTTSGLILDAHDDPSVAQELPAGFGEEHVKTALSLSAEDLDRLPDHVFAAVGQDGWRKFACVDAGTTALSVAAFLKHGHKIRDRDAWTHVANNLRREALDYGLPDPLDLFVEKAAGLGLAVLNAAAKNPGWAAMAAMTVPSVARGTRDQIHQNLEEVRQHERLPAKQAQHFALPSEGRYPLGGYDEVERAASYFDEQCWDMTPEARREYCTNLVKRASDLGVRYSERVAAYASNDYAPEETILAAFEKRRQCLHEADEFLPKLASLRGELEPSEFCEALAAFDKAAGIDRYYGPRLPDPYLSTYGVKRAEEFREAVGKTDTVTQGGLEEAARNHRGSVSQVFGDEFCDRFFKDPVGAYKGLPVHQKKLLARIANGAASGS